MPPAISLRTWKAIASGTHFLSIFATICRLFRRYRQQRLWWDDYLVVVPVFSSLCLLSAAFLHGEPGPDFLAEDAIEIFWITRICFPIEVWTARISLALSFARLLPRRTWWRTILEIIVILFVVIGIALVLLGVWMCSVDSSWRHSPGGQCVSRGVVGVFSLSTDVVADVGLIVIPLILIQESDLPQGQLRLLRGIFCSSFFSSLAAIPFTVYVCQAEQVQEADLIISLVADVQAATTLFVSNLSVTITHVYCIWKRGNTSPSVLADTLPSAPDYPLASSDFSDASTIESTSTFSRTPRTRPRNTTPSSRIGNTSGSEESTPPKTESAGTTARPAIDTSDLFD
ncbi:hypothetical protein BDN72DRAFT_883714 [Pluteus cervinus]|uniref:Uncharacterized protein n=1 Tax=Pluteus cervinus TaxID=181527 RepID=A0ACD3A480_9AGAR|nr:hypothetical protein BDN72DRAFT_883714 [Pluteus cervinus]